MGRLDRRKILEMARRVFATTGFRKTSLDDIAEPLGVTRAALYHHFPGGKDEIIDETLKVEEQRLMETLREAARSTDSPPEKLRRVLLAKIERLGELRHDLQISPAVNREAIRLYEEHERGYMDDELELFAEILKLGEEEGVFRPCIPDSLPRTIQLLGRQIVSSLVFERSSGEPVEEQLDAVLDILFFGIMKRS